MRVRSVAARACAAAITPASQPAGSWCTAVLWPARLLRHQCIAGELHGHAVGPAHDWASYVGLAGWTPADAQVSATMFTLYDSEGWTVCEDILKLYDKGMEIGGWGTMARGCLEQPGVAEAGPTARRLHSRLPVLEQRFPQDTRRGQAKLCSLLAPDLLANLPGP